MDETSKQELIYGFWNNGSSENVFLSNNRDELLNYLKRELENWKFESEYSNFLIFTAEEIDYDETCISEIFTDDDINSFIFKTEGGNYLDMISGEYLTFKELIGCKIYKKIKDFYCKELEMRGYNTILDHESDKIILKKEDIPFIISEFREQLNQISLNWSVA